jgi:hypothetical protein
LYFLPLKQSLYQAEFKKGSYHKLSRNIEIKQVTVDIEQRNRRVRLLIRRLNRERKKQAKKIDILCNDLIAAQRDFIRKLDSIGFAANFYESIVGLDDLSALFYAAGRLVRDEIPDTNVAFFVRWQDTFELHMSESSRPISLGKQELENCFTSELAGNICKSNRICRLEDMFAMGLEGNPARLNRVSAGAIPLGQRASALGFILVYRSSQNELTAEDLNKIAAIAPGLSRAIQSRQAVSHPGE